MSKWTDERVAKYLPKFEIIALYETWTDESPELEGYAQFKKNTKKDAARGRKSGGIVMYIKKKRSRKITELKSKLNNVVWVRIIENEENLIIGGAYRNPENSRYEEEDFFGILEEEIEELKVQNPNAEFVMGGDLNARIALINERMEVDNPAEEWEIEEQAKAIMVGERKNKDTTKNKAGENLIDLCKKFDLVILNGRTKSDLSGEFTYIAETGCSTIDLVITETNTFINKEIDLEVHPKISSRHLPVEVIWSLQEKEGETEAKLEEGTEECIRYKWKENKINQIDNRSQNEIFKLLVEGTKSALREDMIDQAVGCLNHLCTYVMKGMKIEKKENPTIMKNPWFDEDCRKKKKETKRQLRAFRKTNNKDDLDKYLKNLKCYQLICKQRKQEEKNKRMKLIDSALEEKNDKKFWNLIREETKSFRSKNDEIKQDVWVKHFEELYRLDEEITIENELQQPPREGDREAKERHELTVKEIDLIIRKQKKNKTPGKDGIPAEAYMWLWKIEECKPLIVNLFNKIIEKKYWPKEWETSIIIPIYKKGKKENPANYRGISLLPVLSKILTKALGERLTERVEGEGLISKLQAGFRRKHSTIDNLILLDAIIQKTIRKKKRRLYACFVDLKAAFDNVNRAILWRKLEDKKIDPEDIAMLKAIYNNVKSQVKISSNKISQTFEVQKGVRQGCQLSALLFILYVDDIIDLLNKANTHAPTIGGSDIPGLLYADDMVLLSESKKGLQNALKTLEDLSDAWKIEVNIQKTKIMCFSKGGKTSGSYWVYKNEKIEEVKQFTYVGVTLSGNGKWTKHIEEVVMKTERKINQLKVKLFKFDTCTTTLAKRVLESIIEPAMLYGAEVWGVSEASKKLDKPIANLAKFVLGLSKNAVNDAAMSELGWMKVSNKAKIRAITQYLKYKDSREKDLQKKMMEMQEKQEKGTNWTKRIREMCQELDVKIQTEEKFKKKEIKKLIKEKVQQNERDEIMTEANNRTSLAALRNLGITGEGEKYIKQKKNIRREIASLRLGTFVWKTEKRPDGTRRCPMCGGTESFTHWTLDCAAIEDLRKKYGVEQNYLKYYGEEKELRSLAAFIKEAKDRREKAQD